MDQSALGNAGKPASDPTWVNAHRQTRPPRKAGQQVHDKGGYRAHPNPVGDNPWREFDKHFAEPITQSGTIRGSEITTRLRTGLRLGPNLVSWGLLMLKDIRSLLSARFQVCGDPALSV